MPHNRKLRLGVGLIAALTLFGVFALTGSAGAPQFGPTKAELAPNPVTTGEDVLYTVEFPYIDNQSLTRSEIRITFPADWDWLPSDGPAADPNVCTLTNDTTLTCARGTIRPDTTVSQAVKFRTGPPAEAKRVDAILTYFEQASQGDKGRFDFVTADPAATVNVKVAGDNNVSTCAAKGGETVGTKQGLSTANPLVTTMVVPGTSALCSPVSAQEFPVGDPTVSQCPDGVTCTTQVSVTSAPLFSQANPIKLIFDISGKPKNWYKDGVLVPACAGPVATPDPCISERLGVGKNLRLTVLWSGIDPSWEGA